MQIYDSLEAFYAADERRRRSGEADYGVWWTDVWSLPCWRVSYIQATGEVYAVEGSGGRVEVLGVVPPDPADDGAAYPYGDKRVQQTYYRTLDRILAGWPEHCGEPGGLQWVRDALRKAE